MASLRDTVKEYQEELRDGIAWVAFWKEGHSWNAEHFHLEVDGTLDPFDRSRLEEIKTADPAAVILNGYYCGQLGEDVSLDELTAGVRYHYENSRNDIDGFIGAHDDRLPPEVIDEARAAAHAAGLPFSEKPYRDGEEFDPYVFDGSMSIEDYELMHRMIEQERSEQMAEPILSGYLSNLGKYTEGRPAGEWVTFPTTAEHLKEVFDRIGIDFKNYEEWHFTEYQSSVPGLTEHLSEYSHPDELNYLGKLLEMQFDDDREKFIAAIEYGDHTDSLQDIINLAQNLDCYWGYPSVHNEEEYGHYLVDELEEPELPEEAKKYFMYEEYGRDASINDGGMFTEQGYIYNNRKSHFSAELSPYFLRLATDKDMDRLFSMLPYKSLSFSAMEGKHGVYALISKDENRDRSIKKPRPSLRAQLEADKAKTTPKKAAAKSKNHEMEV